MEMYVVLIETETGYSAGQPLAENVQYSDKKKNVYGFFSEILREY